MRNISLNGLAGLLLAVPLLVCGCAPDQKTKDALGQGYTSLASQQYDQALAQAESFLRDTPAGPGTPEAMYLKGRALEQKPYPTKAEAMSGWQEARRAYINALGMNPAPRLETLLHAGLANVSYFLDDYTTAADEWTIAHDRLEDETAKSWVLYRVGLCRQRLGQFADADAIFAAVQERYPNTIPAQRAREHQGVRAFSVQLATFESPANADAALNALRREGVSATRQNDAKGRSVIMVGPVPSYQQAQALKARFAGTYPDALIVP